MARIVYQGDVNIEHGGVFFKLDRKDWDEYGYCNAVRVTPCSDAGAQDNAWWIEELTIIKPEDERLKSVLDTVGWYIEDNGCLISTRGDVIAKPKTNAYRLAIMEACEGYGLYDVGRRETVQIGKAADEFHNGEIVEPDTVLRRNASLERYVRREFVRSL